MEILVTINALTFFIPSLAALQKVRQSGLMFMSILILDFGLPCRYGSACIIL